MQEFYQEGKEAEFFSSLEEFSDKARFYLANGGLRQRMAEAGHRRVNASGHDIHSRMRQWLSDVSHWRNEQFAL